MNVIAIVQSLFAPWILFCLTYSVISFKYHYDREWLCYFLAGFCLLAVLVSARLALNVVMAKRQHDERHAPTWYIFLFVTMFVAWFLGIVLGNLNFWSNMQPYYNYMDLNNYIGVDPSGTRGQQLMDAGRIDFTRNATLDLRKSMGFKNVDTYCVAPISIGGLPLASYDFWAVGLDCCTSHASDFHCAEYDNMEASGGLRLLRDDQRAFFRLAVRQAEATHGIVATHPLFFYWTSDPLAEMESFRDEGYSFYFVGMLAHFLWQTLVTVLAVFGFSHLAPFRSS